MAKKLNDKSKEEIEETPFNYVLCVDVAQFVHEGALCNCWQHMLQWSKQLATVLKSKQITAHKQISQTFVKFCLSERK